MEDLIKREDAIKAIVERFMMNRSYAERMLEDIPTIEVGEDCVSRKWLEENAKEFGDYYENTVWAVPLSVLTDAPSVVPKTQIETQNSNEDAISREWLISFIDAGHLRNPNELCYSERGVVELIKNAPSVIPQPKEGEWIESPYENADGMTMYRCSECGCLCEGGLNYCFKCGAKMRDNNVETD